MGAVFDIVYIVAVRGSSAAIVEEILLPLDDDACPPSAWSFSDVVIDVEHSVSAVQSVLWVDV